MKQLALVLAIVVGVVAVGGVGCKKQDEAKGADKTPTDEPAATGQPRITPTGPVASGEPVDEATAKAAAEAEQTREAVRVQVESILKEEKAVLDEITNLVGQLTAAKSEAERVAAQTKLDELTKQKAEIAKRLAAAKSALPAQPPSQ